MSAMNTATNLAVFMFPAALAAIGSMSLTKSSRGLWKWGAWIPVVPLAVWAILIARDIERDPTSHNLWPFELVGWIVITLILFAAFHALRWVATPSRK